MLWRITQNLLNSQQKSMLNLHIGSNQPTSRSYMTSPLLHNTSPSSSTDNHHKPATRCHSSTPSNKNQVTLSLFSPSGGDVNKSLADGSIKQPVPIRSRVSFFLVFFFFAYVLESKQCLNWNLLCSVYLISNFMCHLFYKLLLNYIKKIWIDDVNVFTLT